MKKIKPLILCLCTAVLSGCYKKPEASFVPNKTVYIAGDTVHLKNTSTNGHSFLWALPDGQKVTTENADYPIPRSQGFDQLSFVLTAYSKREKKSSSADKTVDVIPASVFGVDSLGYTYYPVNVEVYTGGGYWQVSASVGNYENSHSSQDAAGYLTIRFYGTTVPTIGAYLGLSSNDPTGPGQAFLWIERSWWENGREHYYASTGEQINVSIVNGKVHIVFSHINANDASGMSMGKITGDIMVP